MSEEKKIFDKKFVNFMWDDSFEGKEGFFSDSIPYLIAYVEDDALEKCTIVHKGYAKRNCMNDTYQFNNAQSGNSYLFFYHDPLYDVKLAWKEGKQIQSRSKVYIDAEWIDDKYPSWDEQYVEYRVKPVQEKKWRPFKDIRELKQTWLAKNGAKSKGDLYEPFIWVRDKECHGITRFITDFSAGSKSVALAGNWCILEALFDDYEFLDGTPCGVEE
jgi:hypothetical protein